MELDPWKIFLDGIHGFKLLRTADLDANEYLYLGFEHFSLLFVYGRMDNPQSRFSYGGGDE
jgi:hypothetical protein